MSNDNIKETTKITIDDLYKSLKFHDKEILKNYNDKSISDYYYFFNALNFDIISNALSIIINLKTDNIESIGVDNNCRAILEAFLILKMRALNEINDEQLKIFRNQYKLVDYYNLIKVYGESIYDMFPEKKNEYENALDEICQYYKKTKKEIRKKILGDPNLYLNKEYSKNTISFAHLFEKYKIFDEDKVRAYSFFSMNIHPSCEINEKNYKYKLIIKQGLVKWVIDIVFDYFKNTKLFVFDNTITSFEEDIKQPRLSNNIQNIKSVVTLFDNIRKKTCLFEEGFNAFESDYLDILMHAMVDLLIHQSLGYCEQVTNKFKSIIEYMAIHSYINCLEGDEFYIIRNMYLYSSRMQNNNYYRQLGLKEVDIDNKKLEEYYETYYKEKYELDSFEEFVRNLENNSRYFISKNDNSYKKLVERFIDEHFANSNYANDLRLYYSISCDSEHAGGYIFNTNEGQWELMPHVIIHALFKYLKYLLLNIELTFKDNKKDVDFKEENKFIDLMMYMINQNIEIVGNKYGVNRKDIE